MGSPTLVLVQSRLFRPVRFSCRAKRAFFDFQKTNTQVSQSGFDFDCPHHVLVKSGVRFQNETKVASKKDEKTVQEAQEIAEFWSVLRSAE